MKISVLFLTLFFSTFLGAQQQETTLLKYSGSPIEEPYWFKDSFLELSDDISEAADENKKLIVYFHQAGCPYCFNLVQQSLLDPQLSQFIQTHFDVIALNLWGDREVTLPGGQVLTEKELAAHWKVQYTPTLIFYGKNEDPILRIDGYRNKTMLAKILDYVVSGNKNTSLAQLLIQKDASASLYPSVALKEEMNLSKKSDKPVFVLFEYPGCADCDQLHRQVLSRKDSHSQLQKFSAYRVDVSKDTPITLPNGQTLSGKEWATKLELDFYPSAVLFDQSNEEKFRINGYVQSFHFNTALEYVSQKVYQRLPEFQRYINERADRLREQGVEVVITQ